MTKCPEGTCRRTDSNLVAITCKGRCAYDDAPDYDPLASKDHGEAQAAVSATPRTELLKRLDAAGKRWALQNYWDDINDAAESIRQLETELTAARAENAELREQLSHVELAHQAAEQEVVALQARPVEAFTDAYTAAHSELVRANDDLDRCREVANNFRAERDQIAAAERERCKQVCEKLALEAEEDSVYEENADDKERFLVYAKKYKRAARLIDALAQKGEVTG